MSVATGCLYRYGDQTYLITNRHVLSGRNSLTGEPMHSCLALPGHLAVHFPLDGAITRQTVATYDLKDSAGGFRWLEHPLSGAIDVGALPIDIPPGAATFHINDALQAHGMAAREDFFFVSQDVWVIGFPRGIRVNGLPIWKRATIASEPRFSPEALKHRILLDTATREGMSGSPVLYVNKTLSPLTFDGREQEVDFPSARVLLGIYSGRLADSDELAAQIGIAWGAECIEEIILARKLYEEQ